MNRIWFWCGLLLGLDSLVGLLADRRLAKWLPGWPIRRIATVEAILAVLCMVVFVLLTR